MIKTVVQTLVYRESTYTICKVDDFGGKEGYIAVNHTLLDENGRLAKEVNGIEVHFNAELNDTIKEVKQFEDAKYYESQGINRMVAIMMAIEGKTEEEVLRDYPQAQGIR